MIRPSLFRTILPLLLATVLQQGCDLSTSAPTGVVLPGNLDGPDGLPILLAQAVGDFAVAYGGNSTDDGLILVSGLFADELGQTIGTIFNINVDQRDASVSNPLSEDVYRDLQRARASAEEAVDAYRTWGSTAVGALYSRNLAGFAYLLMAETFCSGVPFSRVASDGTVTYGQAETTTQILERALSAFDSALARAPAVLAGADSVAAQVTLAHIGRARSLLDLGSFPDAGTEGAQVPDDFVWRIEYSDNSPREANGVYFNVWSRPEYSAVDSEGVNGIAFLAAGDPRVQVDTVVPGLSYAPLEYAVPAAPITLASGTEARLIQAEALLRGGNASGSLSLLNALRASSGLAPLDDAGTPDGRVTQLFRERAFWLWLTGHRLGDLRRLVGQYQRSRETVYPSGKYTAPYVSSPLTYGNQIDLSVYEVNNPLYDPVACDPNKP